jgi:hypothetical protein
VSSARRETAMIYYRASVLGYLRSPIRTLDRRTRITCIKGQVDAAIIRGWLKDLAYIRRLRVPLRKQRLFHDKRKEPVSVKSRKINQFNYWQRDWEL